MSLDPLVRAALVDLERGLETAHARYCIIGALVPECLLRVTPTRLTNDADAVVVAHTIDQFDKLKDHLGGFRFKKTSFAIRLQHDDGARVDILPYSTTIAPGGRLDLPGDLTFNMAGFERVFDAAITVSVEPGLVLPMAPLPLYAVLKLVAFNDRKAPKDLGSVMHCLRHYDEDADRRYGLETDGALVPFEVSTAYLLGRDAAPFVAYDHVVSVVREVLDLFTDADAPGVDVVARDEGRTNLEPSQRYEIASLFKWFRAGLGV
jgi:predicted nucleotidyltransferase